MGDSEKADPGIPLSGVSILAESGPDGDMGGLLGDLLMGVLTLWDVEPSSRVNREASNLPLVPHPWPVFRPPQLHQGPTHQVIHWSSP